MAPSTPHLLIDGANILHAWPETRHLVRRQRDAARGGEPAFPGPSRSPRPLIPIGTPDRGRNRSASP